MLSQNPNKIAKIPRCNLEFQEIARYKLRYISNYCHLTDVNVYKCVHKLNKHMTDDKLMSTILWSIYRCTLPFHASQNIHLNE